MKRFLGILLALTLLFDRNGFRCGSDRRAGYAHA